MMEQVHVITTGGTIGTVSYGVVTVLTSPGERHPLDVRTTCKLDKSVPLLFVVAGDGVSTIRSVFAGGVEGLVVAGSGAEDVPRGVSSIVKSPPSRGNPDVIASRTGRPSMASEKDPSPGRIELRQQGCFYALTLSSLKVRPLLLSLIDMSAGSAMMAARFKGPTEDPRMEEAMA